MLGFTLNDVSYFYVRDIQGNVAKILNEQGEVVARYLHDSWGNLLYSSGYMAEINPIRYRGYYWCQEVELFYLQSRYYCPQLRRFLSPDIYLDTEDGILGTNMYAYVQNDPVNYYDPDGFKKKKAARPPPVSSNPTQRIKASSDGFYRMPAGGTWHGPRPPVGSIITPAQAATRSTNPQLTMRQNSINNPLSGNFYRANTNAGAGIRAAPPTANSFASAPRIGDSMNPSNKDDPHHIAARVALSNPNLLQDGILINKPSDPNQWLLRVPGTKNDRDGYFEFIFDNARGGVVHAQFVNHTGRGSMLRYFQ